VQAALPAPPAVSGPHLLPAAWLCTKYGKQLDEFGDHAHACKHLKGALVTRDNGLCDVLHTGAHRAKHVCTRSEATGTLLSLDAVPKAELSRQAQAALNITKHRADVAIDMISSLAAAGPTTTRKDKETGEVTAGDGRALGKAADFYAARYSNMQKGNFFPFVLDGCCCARLTDCRPSMPTNAAGLPNIHHTFLVLYCVTNLSGPHKGPRCIPAISAVRPLEFLVCMYCIRIPRGADAAADRACLCDPAVRELQPHAAVPGGLPSGYTFQTRWLMVGNPAAHPRRERSESHRSLLVQRC